MTDPVAPAALCRGVRPAAVCLLAGLLLAGACRLPRVHRAPDPEPPSESAGFVPLLPPKPPSPVATPAGSDDAALRARLRAETVGQMELTAETGGYFEVFQLLSTLSGLPIVVTPKAREVIADESLVLELTIAAPLAIDSLLDLMVARSTGLGWTVRNGTVLVAAKAEARGELVVRMHDVRDLTFPRTEFLPPVIRDLPSGDDFGGHRTGGESDERVAMIEPDSLLQTVRLATDPEAWATEGGGSIEYLDSGFLLVTATPAVQRAVDQALLGLR